MYELKGKVALITGAASGIGFACAKEFLRNELKGVALVDITAENGEKALEEIKKEFGPGSAIFVKADVSDKVQLEGAFDATIKAFKQLDIVMNNAGIIQELQWENSISVNLKAVIMGSTLAIEKYLPKYQSGPGAIVVNTASIAALQPDENVPIYSATKCGVLGFTRAMGSDMRYENTKIRIVAVCPGLINTAIVPITEKQVSEPYLSKFRDNCKGLTGMSPEELARKVIQVIRDSPTGSAWFVNSEKFIQVEFPKIS